MKNSWKRQEAQKLRKIGMSLRKIAKQMGIKSHTSVLYLLPHGIAYRKEYRKTSKYRNYMKNYYQKKK